MRHRGACWIDIITPTALPFLVTRTGALWAASSSRPKRLLASPAVISFMEAAVATGRLVPQRGKQGRAGSAGFSGAPRGRVSVP